MHRGGLVNVNEGKGGGEGNSSSQTRLVNAEACVWCRIPCSPGRDSQISRIVAHQVLLVLMECLVLMDPMEFLAFPGKRENPEDEGNQVCLHVDGIFSFLSCSHSSSSMRLAQNSS